MKALEKVKKPWGTYEVLRIEEGFQVKRIEVNPGHRLSYQKHAKRAERWTIITGKGLVILDGKEIPVQAGSVIAVNMGQAHRIGNKGNSPLVFVEVQLGNYLEEDDIVRLEDDYNR